MSGVLLTVWILGILPFAFAFGAGDIPNYSWANNKAFRHGDIENVLEEIVKFAGGAAVSGGLLGFAKQALGGGKSKFSSNDIKRVYFGNWLRDYSQAMDIAGLTKLSADTLVLVVAVLGFMTFGYTTEEFEVTAERLGVYLPVEHIDNPKGYAAKEGDARRYHPNLRPPVEDRELEIDERTGMKKYMASEGEGFDTSTAHIRRTLQRCIEYGRRAQGGEGPDLWEAYRLLGTALHTLEDFTAHSNWCEIALRKLGHGEVFCHVGDATEIDTPNGRAPPLTTGTFGGADFLHSLMGETSDKLSQASVTALSSKMNESASHDDGNTSALKAILSKLPIGGGSDQMEQGEQLHHQAQGYHFNPDNVAPPDVQKQLLDLLKWRDGVYRDVSKKIEMIPGLSAMLEEFSTALNTYVFTVIAPWVTPILSQVTSVLNEGSKNVIDSDDQYEVFNNPRASDPSHSMLSKDHFALILNEPAGRIAKVIVVHTVQLIVQAWSEDHNPDQVINQVLEAFHHPFFADGRSQIQSQMFEELDRWLNEQEDISATINALSKESVRNHKNKRLDGQDLEEEGYGGGGHGGGQTQHGGQQTYKGGATYGQSQGSHGSDNQNQYGSESAYNEGHASQDNYRSSHNEYESSSGYSRRDDNDRYGGGNGGENQSYYGSGGGNSYGADQANYGRQTSDSYGGGYGRSQEGDGRHGSDSYGGGGGYGRSHEDSHGGDYGRNTSESYGGGGGFGRSHEESHGGNYGRNTSESYGGGGGYGSFHEESHGGNYGRNTSESYGGRGGYGRSHEDSHGGGYGHDTSDSHGHKPSSGYSQSSSGYSDRGRHEEHHGHEHHGNKHGQKHKKHSSHEYEDEGEHEYESQPSTGTTDSSGHYSEESYESNDSTFGAERLNIRGSDDDDEEHEEEEHDDSDN